MKKLNQSETIIVAGKKVNVLVKEVEMSRHNVTPKQFYRLCEKKVAEVDGVITSLYDNFVTGDQIKPHENVFEDGSTEYLCDNPFDHVYCWKRADGGILHCILDFQKFDDEKTGFGYFYFKEKIVTEM